jgi:uncharacterized damage-inducible protein DinB
MILWRTKGEYSAWRTLEEKMPISELLLPEFDQEMVTTRKVLERCPEAKFGWKPHEKSFDMGALATHIATMVAWLADTINNDAYDIAPPGGEPYKEAPAKTTKELLERFDAAVASSRKAMQGASDEHWMQPWALLSGGQTLFSAPRYTAIRSFVLNHCIHHRAQLGVYLRLNDVAVPATYGPSADEQE